MNIIQEMDWKEYEKILMRRHGFKRKHDLNMTLLGKRLRGIRRLKVNAKNRKWTDYL